jgi:tetratricopeptide (TPR) repeat protein
VGQTIRLNPQFEKAYLHLGVVLIASRNFSSALAQLDHAIELDARDVDAWFYRGSTEESLGNSEAALRSKTPDDPEVHNSLAFTLLQRGDADDAITEFHRAIELRPGDASLQGNLGTAFLQKADLESAIAQFRTALKMSPDAANLLYDLALALKLKDDLPAAIPAWNESLRLDPNLADTRYSLGVTLWQTGDFPAAVEQLRAVTQIQPDYAEADYTLGTVLKQMKKKYPESAEALRKSIVLEPDFDISHWHRCCANWGTMTLPQLRRKLERSSASKKPACRRPPLPQIQESACLPMATKTTKLERSFTELRSSIPISSDRTNHVEQREITADRLAATGHLFGVHSDLYIDHRQEVFWSGHGPRTGRSAGCENDEMQWSSNSSASRRHR